MNPAYRSHVAERARLGIPPLPLDAEQVEALCRELQNPGLDQDAPLLGLLAERVPPGVDPAARVKADFLAAVSRGEKLSPVVTPQRAVELLGTMLGGYNVPVLVDLLDDLVLAPLARDALQNLCFVFDEFEAVRRLMERGNRFARQVLEDWAAAGWFTRLPPVPEVLACKLYMVRGEVNTDDLSPASEAATRSDIPLHALSMGQTRFFRGPDRIRQYRASGQRVAFVAETLGTGSSRKSAANSLLWHIGEDIPHVPNKRRGGIALGSSIAPIFFNTFEDSGGLPLCCDVSGLRTGRVIEIRLAEGRLADRNGRTMAEFSVSPPALLDEFRAGGRVPYIIGRKLTSRACRALGREEPGAFARAVAAAAAPNRGYTLAQKLVGRACDRDGVRPGEACEPRMTTVGSQDTTGPMTRDELSELACLSFQAGLVMQSFCHTAAYPKDRDRDMHRTLPGFFVSRGGIALQPGDGIIHSWLNRLILPDTVGTGGDSHTRFPLGISFPAGSGLVAFAAALGCMPLDMPESVLVRFSGSLREGITLRDVVNAIPLVAIKAGMLDRPGSGTKNVFNSRIMEMEGMPGLSVEQAFELTCASAERSAAAATIALEPEAVAAYLRSNVALLRSLIEAGYADASALRRRIAEIEKWLARPGLIARDDHADFAATVEVDLDAIREPVVARPNLPDAVAGLAEIAGAKIDEVFIGSCMTNIGHFRAAAAILAGREAGAGVRQLWIAPPTRMDRDRLAAEGVISSLEQAGARVEIPGCSLCMGNQARVADNATVFSTSTRNFDNRMGKGAQVYLGSAELAALAARLGRIPGPEEYFAIFRERIAPQKERIYRCLQFDAP